MAQGRRLSGQTWVAGDHSHDDFCGRESILKVGGAYLPETPQRRKTPKFPDVTDVPDVTDAPDATEATDADTRCGNNTRCDDGYSNAQYGSNTSQRRRPYASSATTSRNRTEGIKPVGELGNDWKELQDLSYALLFETLKLMILVSMTVVRVSLDLLESINLWLDEGMPKMLELEPEHKENWKHLHPR